MADPQILSLVASKSGKMRSIFENVPEKQGSMYLQTVVGRFVRYLARTYPIDREVGIRFGFRHVPNPTLLGGREGKGREGRGPGPVTSVFEHGRLREEKRTKQEKRLIPIGPHHHSVSLIYSTLLYIMRSGPSYFIAYLWRIVLAGFFCCWSVWSGVEWSGVLHDGFCCFY